MGHKVRPRDAQCQIPATSGIVEENIIHIAPPQHFLGTILSLEKMAHKGQTPKIRTQNCKDRSAGPYREVMLIRDKDGLPTPGPSKRK